MCYFILYDFFPVESKKFLLRQGVFHIAQWFCSHLLYSVAISARL